MAEVLSSIELSWDQNGRIYHRIIGGYSDPIKDRTHILAPSMPMLISHQLGTYKPSHGLILCGTVLDFHISNKHLLQPINTALKGAVIKFLRTKEGVTIQFYPTRKIFSNSDSLEEGSRQLLHNYLPYVSDQLSADTWLIIKGFLGSTLETYFDLIKQELHRHTIGPKFDRWNLNFSIQMAYNTAKIPDMYGPVFPDEANRDEIRENMKVLFLEAQEDHKKLCKALGIM